MRRLFEFSVVAVLLSVLALFILQAIERTRDEVELAAVQGDVAALRAQLMERMAHRATFGGALPVSDNPVDWVRQPPASYAGVAKLCPEARNTWYFNAAHGSLNYCLRNGGEVRYRLTRVGSTRDARGVIGGVGLVRLDDHRE